MYVILDPLYTIPDPVHVHTAPDILHCECAPSLANLAQAVVLQAGSESPQHC